ncbi:haloalkane dehalogenase [Gordonia araii NBRC 100433]|uniref:Haloalkane dehalogenase n=1 Tax=Gordonia araii NBRC 100433 TaxID=1073574 RepID=G7H0U5_9ACTN|nr:haloalkane dehalogenase [Gordonia araii]NNG99192.1 haloalkane dehalogenase [Gordonia araii NBRC 100433]GAB09470.1 haloalkane dehalogenase [Gordonia araii NBRC 100433]
MFIDFTPDTNLYPFASRWFDSSAGRMHYVDEGHGPTILFCHGSPTWSFLYRGIVRSLRSRYRCIAVDQLGFGLSQRPPGFGYTIAEHTDALGELVDHLDLDDYIVVGHDWGGPIGLGAAVPRADRVRGIVLANTMFWPVDQLANRAFSAIMNTRPMRRRILENNLLVEKFLINGLGDTLTDDEADHYRRVQPDEEARVALAATPAQIRAARPLLAWLDHAVPTALGTKPALAVWGMRDPVFRPKACLPRIASAFADLTIVELPDSGHFVPEEAPGEIAAAISGRFR